jgi:hypothetical protein
MEVNHQNLCGLRLSKAMMHACARQAKLARCKSTRPS